MDEWTDYLLPGGSASAAVGAVVIFDGGPVTFALDLNPRGADGFVELSVRDVPPVEVRDRLSKAGIPVLSWRARIRDVIVEPARPAWSVLGDDFGSLRG